MTVILLAAGLSERMGQNKLLLPFGNTTVLGSVIEAVRTVTSSLIIVTGHDREGVEAEARRYNVRTVYAEDYRKGQLYSTLKGLESIADDDFAILPGDLPLIRSEDIMGTFSMLRDYTIARAVCNQTPGHPVVYRKEHRKKLLVFPGTMKEYLAIHDTGLYPASAGCILDVDTPEKYKEAVKKAKAGD